MNKSENNLFDAIEQMIDDKIGKLSLLDYQVGTVYSVSADGTVTCAIKGSNRNMISCVSDLAIGDIVIILEGKNKSVIVGKVRR